VPSPGWPASAVEGRVGIRPLRLRDAAAWSESRIRNEQWLSPWEGRQPSLAVSSWEERHSPGAFAAMLRVLRRESKEGRCLPFAITHDGVLAGQVTVDHCFGEVGLHRVEASIRPENAPSRRVVEKLGFREEGLHPRYLYIDGEWRDHLCFALTVEDVPEGLVRRWRSRENR
jgi:ribosomal-protein-alanine N-acetyltransferase